jgi:hypothetical protein
MDLNEWAEKVDRVRREREALELSYQDLQARFVELGELAREGQAGDKPSSEVADLLKRALALAMTERDQTAFLFDLLMEALTRLAEAYDLELPPGWPTGAGPSAGPQTAD